MKKYYSEEIEKGTKNREEYLDTVEQYIDEAFIKAKERRQKFMTPQKYASNPEKYRTELIQMLGFPLSAQVELPKLIEKKFVAEDGNVKIFRMQLCFYGKLKFYGIYFEQKENSTAVPFIIGLHGGDGTPELAGSLHMDSANYNHLLRRITDRGASVFAPQLLLWKLSDYGGKEYARAKIDGQLRRLGGSVTALELSLLRGCLSYFIENEGINTDKIGAAGMSYGGMYALHLAAVDPRVKACLSCSWFHDSTRVPWADWSYFRAAETFMNAEVAALVAPRALCVNMGDKDELFSSLDTHKEAERAKPYFAALGAEENFLAYEFSGTHEADKGDKGLDFFFAHLSK